MKGLALLPEQASTIGIQVDQITLGLLILSGFIVLVVFGLIVLFGILYRQGSPRSREIKQKGTWLLEWGWTFLTFFIFLGLCGWAAFVYFDMHDPPRGSEEIAVVGKQWMWKFQHPSGKREIDELHVPVNEPILLTMTSQDVIHSLYVPAFRIKQDVLPNRYTRLWFEANQVGEYSLFCAEYCGTLHSKMRGRVIVLPKEGYQQWLQTGITDARTQNEPLSMASRGSRLFTRMGCISCHGTNPGVRAPSLYGIYGKPVALSNGTTVNVDEGYLRESILNPRAKITQGYDSVMPSFAGLLTEEDILDLIAYIKALNGTPKRAFHDSIENKIRKNLSQ